MNKLLKGAVVLFVIALSSFVITDAFAADKVTLTTIMPSGYSIPTVWYHFDTSQREANITITGGFGWDDTGVPMTITGAKAGVYRISVSGLVLVSCAISQNAVVCIMVNGVNISYPMYYYWGGPKSLNSWESLSNINYIYTLAADGNMVIKLHCNANGSATYPVRVGFCATNICVEQVKAIAS